MTVLSHHDYTVAWICALPLEMAAAKTMLDEIHDPLPQQPTDQNTYTLGKVRGHNVVVACLPFGVYGVTSAAIVLAHLLPTFPSVQFGVLVGIAGGAPSASNDIRLGDVVVSKPTVSSGGVIQYDFGQALVHGQFQHTSFLNRPPQVLLTAMESYQMMRQVSLSAIVSNVLDKNPDMKDRFSRPKHDLLFHATYSHQKNSPDCSTSCDQHQLISRLPRSTEEPQVHYGLIASGNQVIKDPHKRDSIAQQLGILCFEMEAAGLMDQLPCLVIRGICDYCDSHKLKQWQGYAALTAAAYTKVLLSVAPVYRGDSDQVQIRRHQEESEEHEAFLHWIPTDGYDQMYVERLEQRCPGTCGWFIETRAFRTWRQGASSSLLWCHGKPGIGKSVLLAHLAKHLREEYCTSTDIGISFSCYDYDRQDLAEPSLMVSAILKQLFQQKGSISQEHLRFKRMARRPSLANLCKIFVSYVSSSFNKVFLLVDALDECQFEARHHMIGFFSHILQHVPNMKILIMSRKQSDIQEAVQGHPSLAIGTRDVAQDITTYVTTEVRRLRAGYFGKKLYIRSDLLEAEVIENLIANADGMFRWASLQLEHLRVTSKVQKDAIVRSALSDTPRSLDATYDRILSRIEDQPPYMRDLAVRTLRCLLNARHPVRLDVLQEAVATIEDHGELDPVPLEAIQDACANFIIEEDGDIRLIHASLREFLLRRSNTIHKATMILRGICRQGDPDGSHGTNEIDSWLL